MEHELNKNEVATLSGIVNNNYDIGTIVAIVQAVNQNAEILSKLIDRLPERKIKDLDSTVIEAAHTLKCYCKAHDCVACVFGGESGRCRLHSPCDWDVI